jgi:hypothetical protein
LVLAPFAAAGFAGAGLVAAAEVFGLNKSPKLDLGDAVGAGVAAASAFLRVRLALGEPAGDATGEEEAPVSAGEAVV